MRSLQAGGPTTTAPVRIPDGVQYLLRAGTIRSWRAVLLPLATTYRAYLLLWHLFNLSYQAYMYVGLQCESSQEHHGSHRRRPPHL